MMVPKRKRVVLTMKDKVNIVSRLKEGKWEEANRGMWRRNCNIVGH